MGKARKKIAAVLKGRNKIPENWESQTEVIDSVPCKFTPGDLVATQYNLDLSNKLPIDGLRILERVYTLRDEQTTIIGSDFAIYVGIERLRVTRHMKAKGWMVGARDNELVHELHHVLLVNNLRVIIPEKLLSDLVLISET